MGRTTGTRRSTTASSPAKPAPMPHKNSSSETTRSVPSDRYVLPLLHVAVPESLVHFGSSREQASRDHYVVPLAHVKVPANWVDYGIWAALGTAVVSEGVTLPIVGALGAGVVLRRWSRPPRR
jgi:hypothetical protein